MHIFVAFEAIFSAVLFASCVAAVILKSCVVSATISASVLHLIFDSKHSTINRSTLYLVLHYWDALSWISLFFCFCFISSFTLSFIAALSISFASFQTWTILVCIIIWIWLHDYCSVTCNVFWSYWINFHHDFDLW